jgi:hypothetical protein
MPLVIYAPRLIKPAVSDVIASQVDFAPTMLHLLGIRGRNSFVGRSLLASPNGLERHALMIRHGQWNLRIGNHYIYDLGRKPVKEDLLRRRQGYNDPSPKTHDYLVTDKDLLRTRDANTTTIGADDEKDGYVKWAKTLIGLNRSLLDSDRVFDCLYGAAASPPTAASTLSIPTGEPTAADNLKASARLSR